MQTFQATVHVFIKPAVLNPAEKPVLKALTSLGFTAARNVRMGKCFLVTTEAPSLEQAEAEVSAMCDKLLINPVTETFEVVKVKETTAP